MTHMQGTRARTTASVQVERFSTFPQREDGVQIPMRKEHATPDQVVRWFASDFLEPSDKICIDFA